MSSLDEVRAKLLRVKLAHELLCAQQDLTLEVAQRDSRFSASLLELMRREESMGKDPNSPALKLLVQRVDDTLRAETQQFFARVVNQNIKKWDSLRQNLSKEIQLLRRQIGSRLASLPDARVASTAERSAVDELAAEEERLQVDYHRNWAQYETFHLREAFASQLARIDRDWNNHEAALKTEYEAKLAAITGRNKSTESDGAQPADNKTEESAGNSKWHHPEKQKTLIHTAPVFAPTAMRAMSGTKRDKAVSQAVELQRLEKEYQDNVKQLQRQKAEARRWLFRQQLRLEAQCEEVHREKQVMADLYENHFQEFRQLSAHLRSPTEPTAASTVS